MPKTAGTPRQAPYLYRQPQALLLPPPSPPTSAANKQKARAKTHKQIFHSLIKRAASQIGLPLFYFLYSKYQSSDKTMI
jgi:hypothetical protein